MQMQNVSVPQRDENGASQRKVAIGIAIGQYHFIDADGWHHEWKTISPREWWKKYLWEKEGGYSQDEDIHYH